jgi:signal transduction histidine kinase/CheY-like chemotaxis protein
LVTVTVFVVNHRITQEFVAEAKTKLATANAVFLNSQKIRTRDFMLRFRGLTDEPRYQAIFKLGDAATLHGPLADFLNKREVDSVFYSTNATNVLASERRDPATPEGPFETATLPAVRRALQGQETVGTVRAEKQLYEIISGPVYVDKNLIGALTFGLEIGNADVQEFSQLTHAQIALLAGGTVVASTLTNADASRQFTQLFQNSLAANGKKNVQPIILNGVHYFGSAGKFESLNGDKSLGYVLLSSYEDSFRALQSTQQLLLLVSVAAIFFGATAIWFLVNRVTRPLLELRDSAEAVGRGDFSRRVPVRSGDECGELAKTFNRMTENVEQAQAQLKQTVETLKTTQAQLIQSEKLSAVGEFVAGVAHELNNPLATVMGFSELLKDAPVEPKYRRHLEIIFKSAQRCQKIVLSLLSFARRHQPERKLVAINLLIGEVLEIVAYQLRTSNVEVVQNLAPNLPFVLGDGHQIQQVLLNLINNARQAIEAHQPSGKIILTTAVTEKKIRIGVQDNGPGISTENLRKIFDPFFTTKEVGKGTGLGLSLCYGLIKEHCGEILVTSQPGEGTTFTIELPATENVPAQTTLENSDKKNPPDAQEGAGKIILVIDDEEMLLQLAHDELTPRGYQVVTVGSGDAALRKIQERPFDAIFCDLKMPGLNGRQVYEQVEKPAVRRRFIFVTGDIINESLQKFLEAEKRPCLMKPFALAELRAAIQKILDETNPL